MIQITGFSVKPLPMLTKDGLQRIDISYRSNAAAHLFLDVFRDGAAVVEKKPVAMPGGRGCVAVLLPEQAESFDALWLLSDKAGNVLARTDARWEKVRRRTIYVMLSSHTDIGLHESPYLQREGSVQTLDHVRKLCDETRERAAHDRYRYTMEGTWFWNQYPLERGEKAARELVRNYIQKGEIGLCCGVAGNHFQTFGLEEMCRSTYERKRILEDWGVDSRTMAIIDINGFPMSMIQPYAEAGVENIIFAPNHWNPIPSTVWKMDMKKEGTYLNPDVGGGGSRVDVRYDSCLPMVFFWEDTCGNRILVWASTQYGYGGAPFGLLPNNKFVPETVPNMETRMAEHLPLMEEKYPYDVWLLCCYDDNQAPNLDVVDSLQAWNAAWAWPRFTTLGDPAEPFRILREKHGAEIPVLRGDITGGWYQHPLTAAELLARKFETDRLLPTAEKWSAVAGVLDKDYAYPAADFRRAWDHLLFNDEHSYGVSGYQGRRVYETWMQHRDWIEKARATAETECTAALKAISGKIPAEEGDVAVFNPTAQERVERIEEDGKHALARVPAFGYRVVKSGAFAADACRVEKPEQPPVVENRHYRIAFADNGSICSVFDKEQGRELLDTANPFRCNELVYTRDNHKTFLVPGKASFEILRETGKITVTVKTRQEELGAEMLQQITLHDHEKRIDMDNRLFHARDMFNKRRYYRYLYFAFPFMVENCRRFCHLNGTVAEYAVDVTGHGTDVYMAANEWCCAENGDHGVALMMLDSQLVEFDHIHPDKTDFANAGEGSSIFAYAATDWLQMHCPGGSHLDYRFRYSITSYRGGWQTAGLPGMAERYVNPVQTVRLGKQSGTLPADAHSFLCIGGNQRLLTLKRADDGDGLIARLYGEDVDTPIHSGFGMALEAQRVRIDETPLETDERFGEGFATYRLGGGALELRERPAPVCVGENGAPAPIGSLYTGQISEPAAAAGEDPGHLYLLWGKSTEADFSHYALYRSEEPGFTADETTFLTNVLPEQYCVGRYVDRNLKEHTQYFYRVQAVNKAGQRGPMSREFSAFTRESL